MAKQVINIGLLTNDGTGDTLRVGAQKINENFTELYTFLGSSGGQLSVVSSITAGDGITVSSSSGSVLVSNKIATRTAVGGIKVGDTLTLSADGLVNYALPTASLTVAGAVKIDGTTVTIDENGVISAEAAPSTPQSLENGIYSVDLTASGELSLPGRITANNESSASISSDVFSQLYWCPDVTDEALFDPIEGGPTYTWMYVDNLGAHISAVDVTGAESYSHNWHFDPSGNFYLPSGGDILDNNGNSVLGGNYELPIASPNLLGGVKVGSNLLINADGLLSVDLSNYATQTYVNSQGFITSSALSGYATQSYVTSQGYITVSSLPNTFRNFAVAGQSDVIADGTTDTLTLIAGTGISITTNTTTDSITITSTVEGGGSSYDQSLNTTDSVDFVSVTADSFISTSTGVPTLTSATNINLTAANAVVVTASPFRLASLTTTQRNALTPFNGDMIYNLTTNKIQGYQNGSWINIDGTV